MLIRNGSDSDNIFSRSNRGSNSDDVKIAVGMLCYQESKSLSHYLKTLTDFDYVICVDGKRDLNEGPALSDDGTRDIIKSFPNTILIDAP